MLATIVLPDRTLDITHVMPSMTTVTSYVLDINMKSIEPLFMRNMITMVKIYIQAVMMVSSLIRVPEHWN